MFGKARKEEKTKTAFEKKRICECNRGKFQFFASCLLRSVEAPLLIKLRYTVQHCLMEFEFHNY